MAHFNKDFFEGCNQMDKVLIVCMIIVAIILTIFALLLLRVLVSPWEMI